MKYIEFYRIFSGYGSFTIRQVFLHIPDFDNKQLTRRQAKWYIYKIIDWYWIFEDKMAKRGESEYISNIIYEPSYISLEQGLRYHDMIPEEVRIHTAVTSNKTKTFKTKLWTYRYQSIKPELMRWYDIVKIWEKMVKIGRLEKVLLDYIYLHPEIKSEDDLDEMRFNYYIFGEKGDILTLSEFATYYPQRVQKIINIFIKLVKENA